MNMYSTIVGFFQSGGFFMYPIAVVFALGLAIAVERWLYLTRTSLSNQALWKKITPYISSGKFQEAVGLTSSSNAAVGSNTEPSARTLVDTARPSTCSGSHRPDGNSVPPAVDGTKKRPYNTAMSSASTSPDRPSRAAARPAHRPGASPAPV